MAPRAQLFEHGDFQGLSASLEGRQTAWNLGGLQRKVSSVKVDSGVKLTLLDASGSPFSGGLGIYQGPVDVNYIGDRINDQAYYAIVEDQTGGGGGVAQGGAQGGGGENAYLFDLGFWLRPANNNNTPLSPAGLALWNASPAFRAGNTSGAPREQNPYEWPIRSPFSDASKARQWAAGWDAAARGAVSAGASTAVAYLAGAVSQQRGIGRETDPYGAPTAPRTSNTGGGDWLARLGFGAGGVLLGQYLERRKAQQFYNQQRRRVRRPEDDGGYF